MQKLKFAEETSNVDDTDMTSGEKKERDKKRDAKKQNENFPLLPQRLLPKN